MSRKKSGKVGPKAIQLVVRVSELLDRDLRLAGEGLGVDMSNLVRMILTEHVAEYVERGLKANARAGAAREQRAATARTSKAPAQRPSAPPESELHRNLEL